MKQCKLCVDINSKDDTVVNRCMLIKKGLCNCFVHGESMFQCTVDQKQIKIQNQVHKCSKEEMSLLFCAPGASCLAGAVCSQHFSVAVFVHSAFRLRRPPSV